jgi:hypothetical protein
MDEAPKRRLAKQRFVTEHLKSAFPNIRWTVDRRIKGGNSARRPDLIWDFGTFVIIVEIDEDQHKTYDKEDLKLREKELLSDLKGKKLVIIYFNPDEYTDKDGKIHPSIFFVERGEAYPLVGWRERFNVLVKTINEQSEPDKRFSRNKLFFDFSHEDDEEKDSNFGSEDEDSEGEKPESSDSDSDSEDEVDENFDFDTIDYNLITNSTKLIRFTSAMANHRDFTEKPEMDLPQIPEFNFIFEYFWKNPLPNIGMKTLEYYAGIKRRDPSRNISSDIEKILSKLNGKLDQVSLFQSLPVFDRLRKNGDDIVIFKEEGEILLSKYERLCLVNDSFKMLYDILKELVSEKSIKAGERSINNVQKNVSATWKLISERIESNDDLEDGHDYEVYVDTSLTENSKCRLNRGIIWEDFKTKNPRTKTKKSDFYFFLEKQSFSTISHSGMDFYLVEITDPKPQPKYENYFRKRLIKNDNSKTQRYIIWDDFKKKYPSEMMKMKDFYMVLEKQDYKKITRRNSIYFGVDFYGD